MDFKLISFWRAELLQNPTGWGFCIPGRSKHPYTEEHPRAGRARCPPSGAVPAAQAPTHDAPRHVSVPSAGRGGGCALGKVGTPVTEAAPRWHHAHPLPTHALTLTPSREAMHHHPLTPRPRIPPHWDLPWMLLEKFPSCWPYLRAPMLHFGAGELHAASLPQTS